MIRKKYPVRAKKSLGQHFLRDQGIALDIVNLLGKERSERPVLEIGPGTGVLTAHLAARHTHFRAVELDRESVQYLLARSILRPDQLVEGDFLHLSVDSFFPTPFSIIGNLPYHISSQIFFKVYENREYLPEVVAMVQKEVADRIASPPGKKTNGILSILLQAWYDIDMAIHVPPESFTPPPKVQSGVLHLRRNQRTVLGCDEKLFFRVVKQSFSTRRKTLRNTLKGFIQGQNAVPEQFANARAEELSVEDFVVLTNALYQDQ